MRKPLIVLPDLPNKIAYTLNIALYAERHGTVLPTTRLGKTTQHGYWPPGQFRGRGLDCPKVDVRAKSGQVTGTGAVPVRAA